MTSIQIDRTDGLSSSTAIKGPCRVATTTAVAHAGLPVIDGIQTIAGDRILDKDAIAGSDRGIWIADTGPWRRAKDFSNNRDVKKGALIYVTDGAANGRLQFSLTTDNPIAVGVTSLAFQSLRDLLNVPVFAESRAAVKALDPTVDGHVFLGETLGRGGFFKAGLLSAMTAAEQAIAAADSGNLGGIYLVSTTNPLYVYKRVFSGPIDIQWFGAVSGSAAVDNGPAIQAAHDALPFSGGKILAAPWAVTANSIFGETNRWYFSTPLVFTKPVTLIGSGQYGPQLAYNGARNTVAMTAGVYGIVFKDFFFTGVPDAIDGSIFTAGVVAFKSTGVCKSYNSFFIQFEVVCEWNGGYYHEHVGSWFKIGKIFFKNVDANNIGFTKCHFSKCENVITVASGVGPLVFGKCAVELVQGIAIRSLSGAKFAVNFDADYVENDPATTCDKGIGSETVTMTIASPCVVTQSNHGRRPRDAVSFTTTGALATGLVAGTTYYVANVTGTGTYTLSATEGGAEINTSGSQSGVHTATGARYTKGILIANGGANVTLSGMISTKGFLQIVSHSGSATSVIKSDTYYVFFGGNTTPGDAAYYANATLSTLYVLGTDSTLNVADGYLYFDTSRPVTISIASPGVVTHTLHNLQAGSAVVFTTTGSLPTGLSPSTTYYVKEVLTANTYTLSATPGGAVINTSGTQSGVHSVSNQYALTLTYSATATRGSGVNPLTGNPIAPVIRLQANTPAAATAHTGTTAETVVRTVAITGGAMGTTGALRIEHLWSVAANDADVKTVRVRFGGTGTNGTIIFSGSLASARSLAGMTVIHNRSASSQICRPADSVFGTASTGTVVTAAVATASDFNVYFTVELADAADSVTLEYSTVELLR